MEWNNVTDTQNDDAWFEDYARLALANEPARLPERTQRLGSVSAGWFPTLPETAHIYANGGTPLDRDYACKLIATQLEGHRIKRAKYTFDWNLVDSALVKEANWQDIEAKAKRLIQGGKVKITGNARDIVTGVVEGDHGTYNTEIHRDDPNSKSITLWACECDWDQYAWGRTRKWKRLEGRPCSHILATYWSGLGMPFDEDMTPGNEPGGAGMEPNMPKIPTPEGVLMPSGPAPGMAQVPGGGTGMVPPAGTPPPQQQGIPNQMAPMPEPQGQVPGQAPEPRPLIPQFPHDPALLPAINPVSVPGQKPQTPLNPLQNPGGTFSHVLAAEQQFVNGDMVQLKQEDVGQTVGLNSGQTATIAANSIGEVLGTDPLGLVNVYYAGPQAQAGNLEPHGITAWHWANDIIPRPDLKKPGPATRRRR